MKRYLNLKSILKLNRVQMYYLFFECLQIFGDYKKLIDQQVLNNYILNYKRLHMKITVKTLKGQIVPVEVEASTTMLNIKQTIKQQKGYAIESQKLVYKGKATQNEDTVQKLNIKDNDFLVVMTTVKKAQPKKETGQKEKTQNKKQQEEKKEQKKVDTGNQNKNQDQKQQKKTQQPNNDPQFENKVTELMNMGFSRQQCTQALRAAFGNKEVAIQYLLNGIPQDLGGVEEGQESHPLAGLLGGSEIQQLRNLLRNDPTAIQPILEQLSQTSPQLYNLISQHPEQFERMIMEDGGDEGDDSMQPQGQQGQIIVSQAESAAIDRLAALGFSKVEAAQAYLACDKNEQLAANLLFDRLANGDLQGGEFEDYPEEDQGDDDNLFQ